MKKIFIIAVLSLASNAFSAPMIVEHETCMLNLEKSESWSSSTMEFLQNRGFKMGFVWDEDLAIKMITHEIHHHEFPKKFLKKGDYARSESLEFQFGPLALNGHLQYFTTLTGQGKSLVSMSNSFQESAQENLPVCVIKNNPIQACEYTVTAKTAGYAYYPFQDKKYSGELTFTGSVTSPITIPNGVNEQSKIELNLDTAKLNLNMSVLSSDNSASPDMVESIKSQVKDELTKLKENFKVSIARVRESNGQYRISEQSINSWSSFMSAKPSFNSPQFIGSTLNIRGYDQTGNISEGSSHGFIDVHFSTTLKCR